MLVARSKGADAVALMSIYANTGQTFYWLKSYGRERPEGFCRPQDRQPSGRCLARDVAGLRQGGRPRAGLGLLCQCRADREIGRVEKPDRRNHQRFLQFARHQAEGVRQRSRVAELEGHRPQFLRQFADRQRCLPREESEAVRGFRSHHAEGLCRLRRRLRALPEGAARPGHRPRPRGATAAMGPHQISDGGRIHDDQGDWAGSTRDGCGRITIWCRPISASKSRSRSRASFTSRLLDPAVKMDASKVAK